MEYRWSNGEPTATWTFQNGSTTTTASAALGSRVIDFVEGNVARPLTSTGAPNPYREPHVLSDLLLRFGTVDSGTGATMNSVTVGEIALSVDGGAAESINYVDVEGNLQHPLTTRWDYVAGGTSATNPRKIEFLLLDDVLPGHTKDFSMTGELTFAWTGSASSIAGSGLIFEAKMGDLDFFPGAQSFAVIPNSSSFNLIPEPSGTLLLGIGFLTCLRRKR